MFENLLWKRNHFGKTIYDGKHLNSYRHITRFPPLFNNKNRMIHQLHLQKNFSISALHFWQMFYKYKHWDDIKMMPVYKSAVQ